MIGTALWVPEAAEWNRLEPGQQPPTHWEPCDSSEEERKETKGYFRVSVAATPMFPTLQASLTDQST